MNRLVPKILVVVLLLIALVPGGKFLYRHFVTDRITDRGGMENPEYAQGEN